MERTSFRSIGWMGRCSPASISPKNKAYSAVSLKMDTDTIHEVSQPGESLYGLGTTNGGRIVTFGEGYQLTDEDGTVVGGIGVSGGDASEDMEVAQAGIEAFESG